MFDLPPNYTFEHDVVKDKYYVKCGAEYVVTQYAGTRKWFKGRSTKAKQRGERWISTAEMWVWRYYDGMIDGYEKK